MVVFKNCFLFSLLLVLYACSQQSAPVVSFPGEKPVDVHTVLNIGKVNISAYEYRKNLNLFTTNFTQIAGHKPVDNDIQKWKNDFIDHTYFLADAYEKGFDKDQQIDSIAAHTGRLYIAQFGFPELQSNGATKEEQQKRIIALYTRIGAKAHMQFNSTNILVLSAKLSDNPYGPQHTFIKSRFKSLLNQPLLTYTSPQESGKVVSVNDFFDYYNSLAVKYDVFTDKDVIRNLKNMVYTDYSYNEALKNGMEKSPAYLADQMNFKNKLIYQKYENEVLAGGPVTDDEITCVYNRMKPEFVQANKAIASFFYFDNPQSALTCSAILKVRPEVLDTLKLPGLIKEEKHVSLAYTTGADIDTIKKTVFLMKDGMVSRPVSTRGMFVIIKKESSSGKRTEDPAEVKDKILRNIQTGRITKNMPEKLAQLKRFYAVHSNL